VLPLSKHKSACLRESPVGVHFSRTLCGVNRGKSRILTGGPSERLTSVSVGTYWGKALEERHTSSSLGVAKLWQSTDIVKANDVLQEACAFTNSLD